MQARPLTPTALRTGTRPSPVGSIMSLPRSPMGANRHPADPIDYIDRSSQFLRIFLFHALIQTPQIRLATSLRLAGPS
jgi:hypothetical protein